MKKVSDEKTANVKVAKTWKETKYCKYDKC